MKVLVTGGTGFIGKSLVGDLVARGDRVTVVTRKPEGQASARAGVTFVGPGPDLEPFEAVVNLAGEPLFGARWNDARKAEIRRSRIDETAKLVDAMGACASPPRVFVNGSAIGIYGDRGEEVLPESADPGSGFLADLCAEWEATASRAQADHGIRTVNLRTGIVLGRRGGALEKMLTPFRFGLGGPIGAGKQWMSWVHLRDLSRMIVHAIEREDLSGPLNGTAPEPKTNKDFSRTLGKVLHRPAFFPVPPVMLELAMGEVATVLVESQRCDAAHALESGFEFRFPDLHGALREILAGKR